MALIGWWQLGDTVNDSSPYKWNSISLGSTYKSGPIGKSFDNIGIGGSNAIHTKLPATMLENGSLTISFWLRQHAGHSTPLNYLFGFGSMYMSHVTSTSTWTLTSTYYQPTIGASVTSQVSFTDEQWYHVCVVRDDAGRQFIYVDGELYDQDSATNFVQWTPNTSNVNFALGAASSGSTTGAATNVQYSDFKVFNHQLSLKEIKELAKGKMFHVDFEDSCDNIGGRVLTASRAASTGYLHQGTGSDDAFINRVGTGFYYPNAQANALTYDGANPVIQYDQSASGHTFTFWINERDYTTPYNQNIFDKPYNGGEGTMYIDGSANRFCVFVWGSSASDWTSSVSSYGFVTNSVWKHTAIVRDPASQTIKWYLDGKFINSTSDWYSPIATTTNFRLLYGYWNNYVDGYLDDFRIYATTLSNAAIEEIYQTKAYLSDYGNFMAIGNVTETDFYYGFDGYISDAIAFDVNVGAGTWTWGAPTSSREALRVINNTDAWDVNLTTKRKFNRPAVFYGSTKVDSTGRMIVGWKDNGTGIANTDYVHSLLFNNTTGFLSASEDGTIILPNPPIYLSQSIWYDFKLSLGETLNCDYQYKDPQVHKEWQDIALTIASPRSEDTLRPAFTHYDGTIGQAEKSWHDNWAVTSLDSQITYYGNIQSHEINEVGTTQGLKSMWSLDFTTASFTTSSGNIYPLTSSNGLPPIYGIGPDKINGCLLLNWTGSGGIDVMKHSTGISINTEWTAMCWIYCSGSIKAYDILGASGSILWTLGISSSGEPYYYGTTGAVTDTDLVVIPNQWNHISWRETGGNTIAFMVNGVSGSDYSATATSMVFTGIGCGGTPSNIFKGRIADVRVYDVALDFSQVAQIYHLSKPNGSLLVSGSNLTSTYLARDFQENY